MIPIKDDAGRVVSVFAAGLDVTERARQYQATFENAAVGIAHFSNNLKWVRVNGALCRIVGYAAHELVSRPVLDLIHPDYREAVLAAIERLRDGNIDSSDAERRYLRKDGATVWVRAAVIAVRRSDGSIDHFVGVFQDISQGKRAEEELRKSEERFRSSILHSPVPTILFDDQEQILAISRSWLEAAGGVSAAQLHRMEDWTIRAYGERSGEVLEWIRRIIATEPEAQKDEEVLTLDGDKRIWNFVTSGLGTLSNGRRLYVSVAQDVTDRRAYEERIEMLMREARHRTKNILGLVQAVARQTAPGTPNILLRASLSASRRLRPIRTFWFRTSGRGPMSRTWCASAHALCRPGWFPHCRARSEIAPERSCRPGRRSCTPRTCYKCRQIRCALNGCWPRRGELAT